MSMDLMVQAMKIKVGNPLRKLVLLKLADNASDLGECWPSYQHIADQCEISKRSVMNHIEALCECGLIKKSYGRDQRGIPATCISSIYVVQEIHQGVVQIVHYLVQQIHYLVQEIHQGVVQELHPESVTLLNQSMNQSMNL